MSTPAQKPHKNEQYPGKIQLLLPIKAQALSKTKIHKKPEWAAKAGSV